MTTKPDFTTLYFDDTPATPAADPAANPAAPSTNDNQPAKPDGKAGSEPKTYSADEVDRIVANRLKKWQAQQEKAVNEAKKLAEMNAADRVKYERDSWKRKYEELERANARAEIEKTARAILQNDGINVPDSIVSAIVTDDADTTQAAVKAFSKEFKRAVQAAVKEQLGHRKPAAGTPGSDLAADWQKKIDAEKDAIKRQELIRRALAAGYKPRI